MTEFVLITTTDIGGTASLLDRAGLSVGGVRSAAVTRAVCKDAVSHPSEVAVLVARSDSAIIGAVVCIAAAETYWPRFLVRHPWAGLPIVVRRVWGRLELNRHEPSPPPLKHTNRSIGKAKPDPAMRHPAPVWDGHTPRILLIVVDPKARGTGVGSKLYEALFSHIRKAWKASRVLAMIQPANERSISLHRSTGWCLHRTPDNWLCHVELGNPQTDQEST